MKYFIISGYIGTKAFDVSTRVENASYPSRQSLVELIRDKTGETGTVIFFNIIELNEFQFKSWSQ